MSIQIKLFVDDLEFNVLEYDFDILQNADNTGLPNSKSTPQPFKFSIEATKHTTFYEWAIHSSMQKRHVKIVFSPVNGMGKSETIELLDVYCIFYQFKYSATGSQPAVEYFKLTPATMLHNGEEKFKHYWAVTDLAMLNAAPTSTRDEKKITNYYLTNRDGEPIEGYKKDDIIVVNLETSNRIGDSVTIDLNNAQYDFEYNGSVLPNDILKNIVIGSDLEQITLKVVAQKQHTS
jgi:hypothetical protein